MPITPYHFGPSGLVGLLCRRWIDPVVFVAANIVVDVEVLAMVFGAPAQTPHRVWHFHTLLVGGIVGAIFGLLCWKIRPVRRAIEGLLRVFHIPYAATARKMILGGWLGVWLHVLIDSVYHYDVQPLWPRPDNPIVRLWVFSAPEWQVQRWVQWICLGLLAVALIVWFWIAARNLRRPKEPTP